jgi:gamma-butyrobetaine dioxygenase
VTSAWFFRADAASRERLLAELSEHGYALVRPEPGLDAATAARAPWAVAARVLGEPAVLLEHQPIAPIADGRSFASNRAATPFHTDSQLHRRVPPHAQLMFCARAARSGGETLLVDTHALLEHVEASSPALFGALFTAQRRIPFVFGDVVGPTVSLRGGGLVFTHSPQPPSDDVGRELAPWLARETPIRIRVSDGELLVVDNQRMLHGREAFEGWERRFARLLVWRRHGLSRHSRFEALAKNEPASEPPRRPNVTPEMRHIVDEMLRGVPPGVLSRRHGVPEPLLYAWRDDVLAVDEVALARLRVAD